MVVCPDAIGQTLQRGQVRVEIEQRSSEGSSRKRYEEIIRGSGGLGKEAVYETGVVLNRLCAKQENRMAFWKHASCCEVEFLASNTSSGAKMIVFLASWLSPALPSSDPALPTYREQMLVQYQLWDSLILFLLLLSAGIVPLAEFDQKYEIRINRSFLII